MTLDKSSTRVQQMFGEIAGRYDFLNRLLSLGIDRSWRRKTVKLVPPEGEAPDPRRLHRHGRSGLGVLAGVEGQDARRGHGLLPADAGHRPRKMPPRRGQVANLSPRSSGGADIPVCPECDAVSGRQECLPHCSATGWQPVVHSPGITLLEADTLHLPFPDGAFQIVSVAFGLRNLSDTDAGLREMVRVCRPGGRVAVLEFSTPTAWPLGAIYGWYFQHLLPRIGQALARNSQAAYNYLPQSVGRFPQGEALAERMRAAGLVEVWFRPFTCGVATLYVGRKDE